MRSLPPWLLLSQSTGAEGMSQPENCQQCGRAAQGVVLREVFEIWELCALQVSRKYTFCPECADQFWRMIRKWLKCEPEPKE